MAGLKGTIIPGINSIFRKKEKVEEQVRQAPEINSGNTGTPIWIEVLRGFRPNYNFINAHRACLVIVIFGVWGIFWAIRDHDSDLQLSDAIFFVASAACQVGLSTKNVSDLNLGQQSIMMALMIFSNAEMVSLYILFVRHFALRISYRLSIKLHNEAKDKKKENDSTHLAGTQHNVELASNHKNDTSYEHNTVENTNRATLGSQASIPQVTERSEPADSRTHSPVGVHSRQASTLNVSIAVESESGAALDSAPHRGHVRSISFVKADEESLMMHGGLAAASKTSLRSRRTNREPNHSQEELAQHE